MSEKKNQRRRFYHVFVRPKSQLKLFAPFFVFMLVWTAVMLTVAYVYHGAVNRLMEPAGTLTAEDVVSLQLLNKDLIHIVLYGSGVSVLLTFGFWLSVSHNVFGPMVQIHRQLERLKAGELDGEIRLRSRDEFQNVAKSVNELTEHLKTSKSG